MNIELKNIKIKDIVEGYEDKGEEGVVAYGGKLDVRPPYQREFIYKDKQRDEVINTINKGFPLNIMYWVCKDDGTFEILDGQQRTISICEYVQGNFSINYKYFHNLLDDEKEKILNYELTVYVCTGTDKEKLEWFKIINIAGEELTVQELRNAIYTGEWLNDAKRYFSKTNCAAYNLGSKYIKGKVLRQDYLEKVLDWISDGRIEDYMAIHQHDSTASELWLYFNNVINWVEVTFQDYRNEMQNVDWGKYYNIYKNNKYDVKELAKKVDELMLDDDVTKKSGIYEYLLDGKEKHLQIRAFTESEKRSVYERQEGICNKCNEHFDISEMEADHITPWHEGGKTNLENCQMLCKNCNRIKSGK